MGYYARGDGFFKFKADKEKEEEITQLIEEIYDICETSYENGTMYFGVSCDDKYFDDYVKEIHEKLTTYIIVSACISYIGDDNIQWQFRWDNDHFEEEYGITLFCRNNKYYVWGADIDAAETEVLSEWSLNELSCDDFLDSLIFPELPCGEIIQLRNRLANHLRSDCQFVRDILADPQHDKTGIIRDADTILADIMEESYEEGFEITGIGMDILKTWLNSSDKKAVEALFYDLTNVEFHDYIRKCQEVMEV